jgi:hypothetical protein
MEKKSNPNIDKQREDKETERLQLSQNMAIALETTAMLNKERDHLVMGIITPQEYVSFTKKHIKFFEEKVK